ncbi:MAG: FMN-binding negative transcriptional regulator [Alphaproteobacteria bacterium]
MYLPGHFREDDLASMHAVMREHDFALLVAELEGRIEAAHLPVLLDPARGERGTLLAHMARANPLWRSFSSGREAIVVFQGPHAYVSPNWYATPGSVPTWNYLAVHAYGMPRILDDERDVRALLDRLVEVQEHGLPKPWRAADYPKVVDAMLPGVVAFEIPIARLEGKWKLSQNKSRADRDALIQTFERSNDPNARAVAAAMAAREGRSSR